MATNNEIFNIKQKHLVGTLVRSNVSKGRLLGINAPVDNSIVTVTAEDFKENQAKVLDVYSPVFVEDFITSYNQPVMAVFGPDIEAVNDYCNRIAFDIDTDSEISVFAEDPVKPFRWTSGDVSKYFVPEAQIIESDFTLSSEPVSLLANEHILANFVDDICHLKLSSQWPLHVKETVSHTLGIPKGSIILNEKPFRADFDQLLIHPSFWAAITAAAAKKSNTLCELIVHASNWQPKTTYKRATVVNTEGKPLAEKISVEMECGHLSFFSEEVCNSIVAGLVPPYDLSAIDITIEIKKTTSFPAALFGDLGHSAALASTEYHYSKIAKKTGQTPYLWRSDKLGKISLISEKVRKCLNFEFLKQTLDECAEDSRYARYYSVFSQSNFSKKQISPFSAYSKGIGIACAQGIAGFSEKYPYGGPHSLSISLTEDGKAFVSLGMHIPKDTVNIYKNIIEDQLGIEKNRIMFIDINSDNVKDFGPNVLSRSITVVPKLLIDACNQIQKKLSMGAKKPLIQQVYYKSEKDVTLFETNTFGSIAISCHMDPVKITPVIDNVTARLKFGRVYETTILARRIRQTICTTISQICPCAEMNTVIDLKVKSNPHLPSGSCSSMIRGITIAALASAISQAIRHELHTFPLYDTDILAIIKKKKDTEVSNEN